MRFNMIFKNDASLDNIKRKILRKSIKCIFSMESRFLRSTRRVCKYIAVDLNDNEDVEACVWASKNVRMFLWSYWWRWKASIMSKVKSTINVSEPYSKYCIQHSFIVHIHEL
ncbi:Down syndrome critical region 3 [Gossypium australe]|uniref:Down syndrome critical region 3 n=1 Tax=Gossypium australe TaxID=47621 RepID=A0A5B6UJF2_9ROSI|nr:Down syndrome critical region 3 [Gossypium australe]